MFRNFRDCFKHKNFNYFNNVNKHIFENKNVRIVFKAQ